MSARYLDLADYVGIAAAVTGLDEALILGAETFAELSETKVSNLENVVPIRVP